MKKQILETKTLCDVCGKETYGGHCLLCGVDHCYGCSKKLGKTYHHAVSFNGSYDGYYCITCDSELRTTRSNPLHNAYIQIENLREEQRIYRKDFEKRSKKAESYLKRLLEAQ